MFISFSSSVMLLETAGRQFSAFPSTFYSSPTTTTVLFHCKDPGAADVASCLQAGVSQAANHPDSLAARAAAYLKVAAAACFKAKHFSGLLIKGAVLKHPEQMLMV